MRNMRTNASTFSMSYHCVFPVWNVDANTCQGYENCPVKCGWMHPTKAVTFAHEILLASVSVAHGACFNIKCDNRTRRSSIEITISTKMIE